MRFDFIPKILIVIFSVMFMFACVPEIKQELTTVTLDVNSPQFQEVLNLSNAGKKDSLSNLLNDPDPTKRYLSARAFCSLSSLLVGDSLLTLMEDPVIDVRMMAARAVGQLGNTAKLESLVASFRAKDTSDVDNPFNAAILESVGKLGDDKYLDMISGIKTYRDNDKHLLLGQARSIYQFAIRGISSDQGSSRMVDFVTNNSMPNEARLMAAQYLERVKDVDLDAYKFRLAEIFTKEEDPQIRMCLAKALGKMTDPEILSYLKNQYKIEKDYRVKLSIIAAYGKFNYIDVVDDIFGLIKDEDYRVGLAAASYLKNNGVPTDALIYKTALQDSLDHRVAAKVYEAILSQLPHYYGNSRYILRRDLLAKIESTTDIYNKANYVVALGYDPPSYPELKKLLEESDEVVVNTAIAGAFKTILANEKFDYYFKAGSRRARRDLLAYYKEIVEVGDAGMLAVIGTSLADPNSQIKALVDSTEWISEALNALNIPKEIETYNELSKGLAYLKDEEFVQRGVRSSKEIDWSLLKQVTDSTRVVVKTTRGNITFKPYVERAPESVASFVALVNDNFYDDKIFHRVVPNFVVQTGCARGDGYGGLNYTVHSELADAIYDDEGYVGMASAGKDTEGSQWFITHRPTPHLDMKYTIFGKVTEGMNIVHNIEVGDKIVDVIILN